MKKRLLEWCRQFMLVFLVVAFTFIGYYIIDYKGDLQELLKDISTHNFDWDTNVVQFVAYWYFDIWLMSIIGCRCVYNTMLLVSAIITVTYFAEMWFMWLHPVGAISTSLGILIVPSAFIISLMAQWEQWRSKKLVVNTKTGSASRK